MQEQSVEFELTLVDNPKNREKAKYMGALEVMFDDENNPLPESFTGFWNGEAGKDIPWGSKVKVTIEILESK